MKQTRGNQAARTRAKVLRYAHAIPTRNGHGERDPRARRGTKLARVRADESPAAVYSTGGNVK